MRMKFIKPGPESVSTYSAAMMLEALRKIDKVYVVVFIIFMGIALLDNQQLIPLSLQRHYSVDLSITDSLIALYAVSDFPLLTTLGCAFHQILLSSDLQEVRRLTQSLVC